MRTNFDIYYSYTWEQNLTCIIHTYEIKFSSEFYIIFLLENNVYSKK